MAHDDYGNKVTALSERSHRDHLWDGADVRHRGNTGTVEIQARDEGLENG